MITEKSTNSSNLLWIDIPNGFSFVQWGNMMDMCTHITCWMWAAEIVLMSVLNPLKYLVVSTFSHTKVHWNIVRSALQHLQTIKEIFLLATYQNVEIGGKRMAIETGNK